MADESGSGGSALKRYGPLVFVVLLAQAAILYFFLMKVPRGKQPEGQESGAGLFSGVLGSKPEEEASEPKKKGEEEAKELPFVFAPPKLAEIAVNPGGDTKSIVMFTVQLGLIAHDTSKKDDPEKYNLTEKMKEMPPVMEKINSYVGLMKQIIVSRVRERPVSELGEEGLADLSDVIKEELNAEIFDKAFELETKKSIWTLNLSDKGNKIEVKVEDVIFTDIVVQ